MLIQHLFIPEIPGTLPELIPVSVKHSDSKSEVSRLTLCNTVNASCAPNNYFSKG
jgi:hypothetical protein